LHCLWFLILLSHFPALRHHNNYNRIRNHRQCKAVRPPEDGRKHARNMLRIDWLLINHLLRLVGCTFIYLHKMHGHPNMKLIIKEIYWKMEMWWMQREYTDISLEDGTPCRGASSARCYEGRQCLHCQCQAVKKCMDCVILNMTALWSFETRQALLPDGTT
jgi:hypothetical protein